ICSAELSNSPSESGGERCLQFQRYRRNLYRRVSGTDVSVGGGSSNSNSSSESDRESSLLTKLTQQKNSARHFTSFLIEINKQTLLETSNTNNKKQKITTETMKTSSPKVINKVIENIILFTDNNNQTPFNIEKENTTIFLT
ncbi:12257_t:CDS:2, partial [Funneliformis mosseae]